MGTDPNTPSDYWTSPHSLDGSSLARAKSARINDIAELKPLGPQFGVDPKAHVPDAIRDELFGQTENQTGPPLLTYALLDAARVENLPEQLEGEHLECRCLFIGEALADMSGVAPWLVRLEENNRLTRKLFSEGGPPQGLWNCEGGIFLRSRLGLDAVWRHLRRFVRVRDENDKWFYYRFWEPTLMMRYMQELAGDGERAALWSIHRDTAVISAIIACDAANQTCKVLQFSAEDVSSPKREFRLGSPEHLAFAAHQRDSFLDRLTGLLARECEIFANLPVAAQRRSCEERLTDAMRLGLKSERAVADFALAFVLSGGLINEDPRSQAVLMTIDHELDRARTVLDIARKLKEDAS